MLKEFERNYNLSQIIKGHSRVCEGSKSLIDLIYTDITHIFSSGILDTIVSDHLPVTYVRKKIERRIIIHILQVEVMLLMINKCFKIL